MSLFSDWMQANPQNKTHNIKEEKYTNGQESLQVFDDDNCRF